MEEEEIEFTIDELMSDDQRRMQRQLHDLQRQIHKINETMRFRGYLLMFVYCYLALRVLWWVLDLAAKIGSLRTPH